MTEVPQGFDFSFLNEEEARTILRVLERNEELRRAEKDRIRKLQKTKRDIRWLQGVTGEWFEEIQRKKFCNETDVSQMLKQPLTYRLRNEIAQHDSVELQASRSKNLLNQKPSVPCRMSFRSSFASLFSFRKAGREPLKLQWLRQKGYGGGGRSPVSVRGTIDEKISSLHLENQPVNSVFVPKPSTMREESRPPPWEASRLENEFFQVLDDLDSKLAQEQSTSSANASYASSTQSGHSYSNRNRPRAITRRPQNRHETSNMSIYDILRPGTPREGFKTFSPRTKTIYNMYRTKEPSRGLEDSVQKNTFGSTSLCFDSRQRSASPATGHFTARSLHFPTTTENRNRFVPASHQQSPKRTPLSSIIWNRSDFLRDRQNQEEFHSAPSPMEIDPAEQCMYPHCLRENRRHEWFHSQNAYQNARLNDPLDTPMHPDIFENSENMPFYHQDNPFARSFFSNAFKQSREHRFGQSSFWGQQEECYSCWPDFHQGRKPFNFSNRDFEMFPSEANVHGHSVPPQHWRPFSPVFRSQENPYPWQSGFQMPPLENMEISHTSENQSTPYFGTPTFGSMSDLSHPMTTTGLEYQKDSCPEHMQRNKEPFSFGIDQNLAPSFRNSFPQVPDDKRNSQSPNFPNFTVTLQNVIPNKPDSLPGRCHTEATVTNSTLLDSLPLAETQPNILVTEMNEKDMNESLSEDKQLHQTDQTNMTEIPPSISQTVISNPLTDFQNPLSQDPVKNDRFGLNSPSKGSSRKSPRAFSRKNASPIWISQRDTSNELKGIKKLDSAAFLPFLQQSTMPLSFPSPSQSCRKELAVSKGDISSTSKNNQQCSEPTDNQNTQSPEESSLLDTEAKQYPTPRSTSCSKMAANRPCDSLALSSGITPNSSPSNYSFRDARVISSTTRSPSDNGPALEEREDTDNATTKQNSQCAIISPSETPKSNDGHVPLCEDVVDFVKGHSRSPFRNGKVRHRVSCIEKLSQTASCSIPPSEGCHPTENQNNPKASELNTIYCTLPRKSASFLINGSQPESKVRATSIRNGPLPFQIKNTVPDPVKKYESSRCDFPESVSECSKVVSDSITVASEATEKMAKVRPIRSASVRKGPLPFLVGRSMSCPSEKPQASTGSDETNNKSVLDTDAASVTPKTRGRLFSSLESKSPIRDGSSIYTLHPKELFQECTEKMAAPGTGEENPLPFCADIAQKENKNTLHKFKTTSMFSVSGNEDNVKCLEVVSIYYTLPRKASKKVCNLLQQYAQNTSSLMESLQVETEASPRALGERVKDSTQERSSSPSPNVKMTESSAQSLTDNKLPDKGPSEPTLEEMAPVSLHQGESKAKETLQGDLVKTLLGDFLQSRKQKGRTLQRETLPNSLTQQDKNTAAETPENSQESIQAENSGPSSLPAHSEDNVESSQTRRGSGESAGTDIAIMSTPSTRWSLEAHLAPAPDGSSSEPHPGEIGGEAGTDHPKVTEKTLAESQTFALTSASQTLQFEETHSGEPDSGKSEPRELPQGNQELTLTESRKAGGERQKLDWDQTSLTKGNHANDTNLDILHKGEDRSTKHRLAAMSKANQKFPSNHFNPKRHVATIFPQSGSESGFGLLSLGRLEDTALSPRAAVKPTESVDENILRDEETDMEVSENPLQVTGIASREPSSHSCHQKSNDISQRPQSELKNVSESPPKHENSKDVPVAQLVEEESASTAKLISTSLREADFSDYQRRLSPPFSLETVQKSLMNLSLASYQQQHRRPVSPGWEPEPQLYRSKSLKSIHVHSDLRTSQPPKARGRHFSESTSIDNALSPLTLGNDFSNHSGYNRRFKSFSEFPSCDENENWALYSENRTKTGLKSTSSISRPIDYGIFGKEQQLAFLENVKRSLTQGRLWKPSFLKNPGFLKHSVNNPANPSQTDPSSSSSPEDGSFPIEPLNIYEEDPVESDWDTDTTTDDEYYLDEKDKESEL
ncbi:exophilin-5-like isoform X2 [Dipodomys merriami]|uniref:exophilin-5-like isoform X2 n=1 Tax=Dipodomys merriami TaxID=94247 RepID=UPI00385597B6